MIWIFYLISKEHDMKKLTDESVASFVLYFISMKIELQKLLCKRCGYKWTPRKTEIRICPKCKSPYWDRERKKK